MVIELYYIITTNSADKQPRYVAGPFATWGEAFDYKKTNCDIRYEPYRYDVVVNKIEAELL